MLSSSWWNRSSERNYPMASSSVTRSRDLKLKGVPASPGIAVGRVLRLDERRRHQFYYIGVSAAQSRMEVRRLREALQEARAQLQVIKVPVAKQLGYEHSFILDAHPLMLEDARLIEERE